MQTVSRVKRPAKKTDIMTPKAITVKEAIEDFLTDRGMVARCRQRTVENYRLQLCIWERYERVGFSTISSSAFTRQRIDFSS